MTEKETIIEHLGGISVDFIGVGVLRAGTTWLSQCLDEHPQICLSQPKETHFFDQYSGNSYASYFKHCTEGAIQGEFSPSYYLDPAIAKTIATSFPNVKIIICLRDPVQRAFSHYVYNKNKYGGEMAFSKILENTQHPYIDNGFYYKHLHPFLEHFDISRQVMFVFHEEMRERPYEIIASLYSFLGVDDTFTPSSLKKEINATVHSTYLVPSFNRYMKLLRKKLQRSMLGRCLIHCGKTVRLHYVLRLLLRLNHQKQEAQAEKMLEEHKTYLRQLYRVDGQRLGEAYGLHVPWL